MPSGKLALCCYVCSTIARSKTSACEFGGQKWPQGTQHKEQSQNSNANWMAWTLSHSGLLDIIYKTRKFFKLGMFIQLISMATVRLLSHMTGTNDMLVNQTKGNPYKSTFPLHFISNQFTECSAGKSPAEKFFQSAEEKRCKAHSKMIGTTMLHTTSPHGDNSHMCARIRTENEE